MGSEIKVEVLHRETIRPSSPTPDHLKTIRLSVFDQLSPDVYVPLLLFYPNVDISIHDEVKRNDRCHSLVSERSKHLKTSLSETLTHFYPFAGKFQYNDSIWCNDNGAAFLVALVNCPMSNILDKPDAGMGKQLLPTDVDSTQADMGYLLLVQANFFQCGGLAIGVSVSHKVSDASTLSAFIKSWASIALGSASTYHVVLPAEFGAAASLFPPLDFLNAPQPAVEFPKEKCKTRRFVFNASKIAALKSKAASVTVPNPTRVQVVSALIWKCGMEASRSNLGCVRPSEWFVLVNMRKILVQPSAENVLGNFIGVFATKTEASKFVDNVESLVTKLREEIEGFKVKYGIGINGNDVWEFSKDYWKLMIRNDVETYSCSSWCRFPFYENDFGWGKPSWVTQGMEFKNLLVLMDTRDGDGIEVSLTLKEEDMAIFESNKELLEYASLNPTVI
ncbi:hypothetical protein C1H46_042591 [Malus baccata]|uniref:BAHD acyltransferase n=1 Tax=Malus baccata TaxID=106549 RepID=A0A540KCD1_MALBA|nr:hypothetical protein C1H46_042591 [Malus baccata]